MIVLVEQHSNKWQNSVVGWAQIT